MALAHPEKTGLSVRPIECAFEQGSDLGKTLDIWNSWRDERLGPRWVDVDLSALPPPILPNTLVVDVVEEGKDFVYRFWGSGFTTYYGVDETQSRLSNTMGPAFVGATRQQLEAVMQAKIPLAFEVEIIVPPLGVVQVKQNLRLPIMDEPETVTKVLSASTFEKVDHQKVERMREAMGRDIGRRIDEEKD